jgi:hypothetical protein
MELMIFDLGLNIGKILNETSRKFFLLSGSLTWVELLENKKNP